VPARSSRSLDDLGDRDVLDCLRTRGQVVGVLSAAHGGHAGEHACVFRVHQKRRIEIAGYGEGLLHPDGVERSEAGHAGIDEEALEAEDAASAKSPHLGEIAWNRSAPKAHIDIALT